MNQSEMTIYLRKLIAKAGIKARVRKLANSRTGIQVFTVAHEVEFTHEEQRFIRTTAQANKLTLIRGLAIDTDRMTDPAGMEFHTTF